MFSLKYLSNLFSSFLYFSWSGRGSFAFEIFGHTSEYFVLIDKEGRIRSRKDDDGNILGVYNGTSPYEVGLLIDDIKVLMAEYSLSKKDKNEKAR